MHLGFLQKNGKFLPVSELLKLYPASQERVYIPIAIMDNGNISVVGILLLSDRLLDEGETFRLQLILTETMISAKLWGNKGCYKEQDFLLSRKGAEKSTNSPLTLLEHRLVAHFMRNPYRISILIGFGLCILILVGGIFAIL